MTGSAQLAAYRFIAERSLEPMLHNQLATAENSFMIDLRSRRSIHIGRSVPLEPWDGLCVNGQV